MTVTVNETTSTTGTVPTVTMPASVFRDGLAGCLVAAGRDGTLPTLCTVLVEWDGSTVRFVSTDRYRLAQGTIVPDDSVVTHGTGRVLIYRKDAAELVKVLPKVPKKYGSDGTVTLSVQDHGMLSVLFIGDGMWSREFRSVDGEFPKIQNLIPTETKEPVSVMSWNPDYMADAAKIPHDARNVPITWMFSAPNRPMVGTYPTSNGIDWLYLLMPVRLR